MPKRKVRILKLLPGVFTKYQPEVGKVYEANYNAEKHGKYRAVCVIDILDKRICLKDDEYEIMEDCDA